MAPNPAPTIPVRRRFTIACLCCFFDGDLEDLECPRELLFADDQRRRNYNDVARDAGLEEDRSRTERSFDHSRRECRIRKRNAPQQSAAADLDDSLERAKHAQRRAELVAEPAHTLRKLQSLDLVDRGDRRGAAKRMPEVRRGVKRLA